MKQRSRKDISWFYVDKERARQKLKSSRRLCDKTIEALLVEFADCDEDLARELVYWKKTGISAVRVKLYERMLHRDV